MEVLSYLLGSSEPPQDRCRLRSAPLRSSRVPEVSCHLTPGGVVGRRGYPTEFRRKVLDLVASGRKVVDVARDLEISDQTIFSWPRQHRIDWGLEPGMTTPERAELAAARRRIEQLEAELEGKVAVRGHRGDGRGADGRRAGHAGARRQRLGRRWSPTLSAWRSSPADHRAARSSTPTTASSPATECPPPAPSSPDCCPR